MYQTSTLAELGLYDDGAKEVMSVAVSGPLQSFANPQCLLQDSVTWENWFTGEPNRSYLDGAGIWMPDNFAGYCWSIWGSELSSATDGTLATPIVVTLSFATPRTTVGFDIHFDVPGNEWMQELTIVWYDASGRQLTRRTYTPDAPYYFASNFVNGFSRVVFTFNKTSKPERYAKIMNIDMGHLHVFNDTTIFEAKIDEEFDPTSQELTVNTFSLKAWDPDADFSFLNRKSFEAGITDYQAFNVWEFVEGEKVFMGKFYLDTWKAPSQNTAEFTAKDIVGTMDGDYHQGGIYVNKLASELIDELFLGQYAYYLDPSLRSVRLSGWLPNDTVRHNLKQIAFALGANIITARDNKVNIVPDTYRSHTFYDFSRQFVSGTSFELKKRVTRIIIHAHTYSKGTLLEQLHTETYSPGEYIINFDEPVHDYKVTSGNASITFSHANWATIRVTASSEVTIEGYKYVDSITEITRVPEDLPPIVTTNIERFETGTLVGLYNVEKIADRLEAYFAKRIQGNCLVRLEPDELLADTITMRGWHDSRLRGIVERYTIDLAKGFRAECLMTGELTAGDWLYFMPEIYMDNDVVI